MAPMGRHPQPQIRQRLFEACTASARAQGLPDRLGPFAAATGTSSRMLIYHFQTRDGLLREVLVQARRRQVATFTDLLRLRPDEPYPATLARGRALPRPAAPRPRRALPGPPGPGMVGDLRTAGRAVPAHVQPAARQCR